MVVMIACGGGGSGDGGGGCSSSSSSKHRRSHDICLPQVQPSDGSLGVTSLPLKAAA